MLLIEWLSSSFIGPHLIKTGGEILTAPPHHVDPAQDTQHAVHKLAAITQLSSLAMGLSDTQTDTILQMTSAVIQ